MKLQDLITSPNPSEVDVAGSMKQIRAVFGEAKSVRDILTKAEVMEQTRNVYELVGPALLAQRKVYKKYLPVRMPVITLQDTSVTDIPFDRKYLRYLAPLFPCMSSYLMFVAANMNGWADITHAKHVFLDLVKNLPAEKVWTPRVNAKIFCYGTPIYGGDNAVFKVLNGKKLSYQPYNRAFNLLHISKDKGVSGVVLPDIYNAYNVALPINDHLAPALVSWAESNDWENMIPICPTLTTAVTKVVFAPGEGIDDL